MFERFVNFFRFNNKSDYITLYRRGYPIILEKKQYDKLNKKKQFISLVLSKGKPSCVQVTEIINGKHTYISSLKKILGVKDFLNGNVCDFRKSNIL